MLTGLLFLWLLLSQQDASQTGGQPPLLPASGTSTDKSEQIPEPPIASGTPTFRSEQVPETPDTSFFQKISGKMSDFQRHFSPEKVYLQFDRPFFEPGEAIWFNAYVRNANSLKASPKSELLHVELLAPNGSTLKKITLLAKGGTAAGDFQLDPTAPGGIYKIKAWTNWQRNTGETFERDIQVQASVLPRLRMELDFLKKAYGGGDLVEAKLDLNTLANQPLANHAFSAVASLDGQQFVKVEGKTDGKGHARVKFNLPGALTSNDGLLNILIAHEGQTESISRSIPIVLNKVDLQFLPEGGDLVAGLPAAVAFKALNEWGKPADVEGKILDSKNREVATFKSYHQGMGAFNFTPEAGETYHAVLTKPDGASAADAALPEALPRGYALKINPLRSDKVEVEVNSTEDETLHLALVCRGEIYFTQSLPPQSGSHRIEIPTKTLPIGIAQITLFDSYEIPRAERLVFLNPHKQLNISVQTDKEKYLPREKVTMRVQVTDERGIPMPGQFSLAVADDNLLTFADDKQGHILSQLLLESDLKGKVEEPNFYFEPREKHPEKNELLALDYLLMTQGWRRLAWESLLKEEPMAALNFEGEKAQIKGKVVDSEGKPFPRVLVSIEGSRFKSLTDEAGGFTFDTLIATGTYAVHTDNKFLFPGNYSRQQNGQPLIRLPYKMLDFKDLDKTELVLKNAGNGATLQGRLTDADTGEPIIFGPVAVFKNGILVTGVDTDLDGYYSITDLDPGKYDVEFSYTGYGAQRVAGVEVQRRVNKLDGKMNAGINLAEVVIMDTRPLIQQDNTTMGMTLTSDEIRSVRPAKKKKSSDPSASKSKEDIKYVGPTVKKEEERLVPAANNAPDVLTSEEIKNLPTRSVNGIAALSAGVASADEGEKLNIRGSRSDATNYYIDDVRVSGRQIFKNELSLPGTPAADRDGTDDFAKDVVMDKQGVWQDKDRKLPADSKYPVNQGFSGIDLYTPRQFYAPKYDAAPRSDSTFVRNDFRKTVFFQPKLEVGRNGKASVEFYNSDAISTFRATVEGVGTDGSVGRTEHRFFTQLPFGMSVKAPVNLLTGDRLAFPLTLTNNTPEDLRGELAIEAPAGFSPKNEMPKSISLKAGETKTIYPEYEVGYGTTGGILKVAFAAKGQSDAFEQELKVQPKGFPVAQVFGGSDKEKNFSFDISDPVEGSLQASFTVHPSVLSDLTTGLERMIRQPYGCFEQTSSVNYPNVLVLNLLKTTNTSAPDIEKAANQHLDFGYNRLKTFEVKGGGFDWYGNPPATEALTAYGLMELVDMQAVYQVEQDWIDRTARWLLSRKDGKGGWLAAQEGGSGWRQKSVIADAYITWGMTEAGYGREVAAELTKTVKDAKESADPYIIALAAKSLLNLGDRRAVEMLEMLQKSQAADGSWTGKTMSMTHSTGKNLTVETTSIAALAFLSANTLAESGASATEVAVTEKAVRYLAGAKTQYGFGSTQATVLALKALVAHAERFKKSIGGEVAIFVNGKKAGERPFTADQKEPIVFEKLTDYLKEGKNEVQVRFTKGDPLPYDFSLNYSTRQPQSSPDCKLALTTELKINGLAAKVGDNIRLTTTLTNVSSEGVPNPIAIVGIPAGLSVQPWQVKEMQEKKLCDFYEIRDGYVVFYFRGMEAKEVKNIHLDLKADIPGEYEAPASAAWLYYSNEDVAWSKPERVRIEE